MSVSRLTEVVPMSSCVRHYMKEPNLCFTIDGL